MAILIFGSIIFMHQLAAALIRALDPFPNWSSIFRKVIIAILDTVLTVIQVL